jgi:hypothetical protein
MAVAILRPGLSQGNNLRARIAPSLIQINWAAEAALNIGNLALMRRISQGFYRSFTGAG